MKTSLANAIKRKTHKERSQPAARLKYGLLEKHKDYVKRAKDFHKKEKTIKTLRRKAEERNPDEFYFAMEKKRTKNGVHDGRLNSANKYTQDELALMKSQDVKYLSMKEKAEAQKIARLRESLHFIGAPSQNKHVVFVESAQDVVKFDPEAYFDTPKELLGRSFNRPRQAQLADPATLVMPKKGRTAVLAAKADKQKVGAYKELSQRLARHASISRTAARLAYEKEVAGKGRKRKLSRKELQAAAGRGTEGREGGEDGTKGSQERVFVWKRERKK